MLLFFSMYYASRQILPSDYMVVIPYHYKDYRLSVDNGKITFLQNTKTELENSIARFALFSTSLKYYLFVGFKPICITKDMRLEVCDKKYTEWVVRKEQNGYTICSEHYMNIYTGIYELRYCITLKVERDKEGEEHMRAVVDAPRKNAENQIFLLKNSSI